MIYQYQLCSLSSNLSSYPRVICFALLTVVATVREGHHFGPTHWHRGRTGQDLGPGSLGRRQISTMTGGDVDGYRTHLVCSNHLGPP